MENVAANIPAPGTRIKIGKRTFVVEAAVETGPNTRRVSGRGGNPVVADLAAKCGRTHYVIGQRANGEYILVGTL